MDACNWLTPSPPKYHILVGPHPLPVNVTLNGKRISAEVIRSSILR